MKRLKILAIMVLLIAVIAATVVFTSPYAPVVEPARDIEEIWAIEDARQESETPLLTALENNGVALGYDWYENTFYCTLGMDNMDVWPEIHLTAPQAGNLQICFVDDYRYDWCSDAIRDGYPYQIIAYNDEYFSYAQIVFTGLPIVCMTTDEEIIAHVDVAAELTMSFSADEGISAHARSHKRGATTLRDKEKNGYKVEITRNSDGTRKTQTEIPGLGLTDEFVMLSCVADADMMRDKLSWDLYNMLSSEEETMGARKLYYAELFVNDRYQGVYLVFEPFNYEKELRKTSISAPEKDSIYRLVRLTPDEVPERPLYTDDIGYTYELYYTARTSDVFAPFERYAQTFTAQSNEVFCEGILKYFDIDSVIRYYLLVQAGGMTDSIRNNLYIWAHHTQDGIIYKLAPWDLDVSWGRDDDYNDQVWYPMDFFDRMLELDCGGIIRKRTYEIWQQMRQEILTAENIERLTSQYVYEMGDTYAFTRDSQRWGRPFEYPDGFNICSYSESRFAMMDRRLEEIASDAFQDRALRIEGYTTFDEGELEAAMAR